MNNQFNIAVVGLGQIGSYLFKELNNKKNDIFAKSKYPKMIPVIAFSWASAQFCQHKRWDTKLRTLCRW